MVQVGSEVARRARGLGMTIIAHDPFASEAKAAAIGVKLVSLNDALAQGDFFSLHMPLTAQTKVRVPPPCGLCLWAAVEHQPSPSNWG